LPDVEIQTDLHAHTRSSSRQKDTPPFLSHPTNCRFIASRFGPMYTRPPIGTVNRTRLNCYRPALHIHNEE
jgi:hypothetical protein